MALAMPKLMSDSLKKVSSELGMANGLEDIDSQIYKFSRAHEHLSDHYLYFWGMSETTYKRLILHAGKERSLRNRHPWVFSGAIQSNKKDESEGNIVEVFDHQGHYLATGHFHHGTIMVRVISFEQRIIDQDFWNEKIKDAFQLRKSLSLPLPGKTTAYRLIHGEGDGLPGLVVDIYDQTAVIQAHSEGMRLSIKQISSALQSISEIGIINIYDKSAEFSDDPSIYPTAWLLGSGEESIITENGHQFIVNWKDGQKTGFFLDQRDNRQLLSQFANGKNVLNTFCYSGGFSVYALKAGATQVTSVDSSRRAMDWTEKNVLLNMPDCSNHFAICDDVNSYLKHSEDNIHDLIVLDPPAFAKHLSAVDRAVVGYRNLNETAIRKIKKGGVLFTFSCSQAIDKQLFRKTVFMAAAKTGRSVRILYQLSQGADHPINLYHPEGEYLKGLVLKVD